MYICKKSSFDAHEYVVKFMEENKIFKKNVDSSEEPLYMSGSCTAYTGKENEWWFEVKTVVKQSIVLLWLLFL